MAPPPAAPEEDHHGGLARDLPALLGRRRALSFLTMAGAAAALVACGQDAARPPAATTATTGGTSTTGRSGPGGPGGSGATSSEGEIPEETAGPFPGDGSNGPNVLTEDGVVRRDIRSSFGSSTTTAEGIPLTITLTVTRASGGGPYPGATVYLWHCDREGRYSLYSDGAEDENYLRGVQEAGSDGTLTFTTVFPGAYPGRWPHAHFEVYPDLDTAMAAGDRLVTSQLALPEDVCDAVYATDGYEASVASLARTSLQSDMVFADDGAERQLVDVTGSASSGYTATLTVPVA